MRQRSKSLHIDHPSRIVENFSEEEDLVDSDSDNDGINSIASEHDEPNIYKIKESNCIWSPEEDLHLVCQVAEQIPAKDTLPYEKRLSNINWSFISVKNGRRKDYQRRFEKILSKLRTWRTLREIVSEAHKQLLSTIPLPAKPGSGFTLFMKDHKEELVTSNKNKSLFFENASQHFKNLDEEQRDEYRKRAANLRENYLAEVSKYKLGKKKKRTANDDTPVGLFWRSSILHKPVTFAESRKIYLDMSEKEKLKWILRFLGVKYENKLTVEQMQNAIKTLTKDELQIVNTYEGRPKKLTAYNIFMKEFLNKKRIKNKLPWSDLFKMAIDKWKGLSSEQKLKYDNLAIQAKNNYEGAKDRFLNSLSVDRRAFELSTFRRKPLTQKQKKSASISEAKVLKSPTKSPKTPKSKSDKIKNGVIKLDNMQPKKSVNGLAESIEKPKKKRNVKKSLDTNKVNVSDITTPSKKTKPSKIVKTETATIEMNESVSKKTKSQLETSKKENSVKLTPKMKQNLNSTEQENSFFKEIDNLSVNSTIKQSQSPKKKRKLNSLSDSQNELNPLKIRKEQSANSVSNSMKEKKTSDSKDEIEKITLTKPPNTVFQFFKQEIYKGPMSNAKKAFKSLTSKEKSSISLKYNRAKNKYLSNFETYLKSLSQNEIYNFAQMMQEKGEEEENEDDSDSDS